MTDQPSTADRILDVAEALVQTRGFNGFSYADVAAEVGIRKASLHYHFPTKADLGSALVARYTTDFMAALTEIEESDLPAITRLERYVSIYETVLLRNRMCLCGMLVAEYTTLPGQVQGKVREFFERNEQWLAGVLDAGQNDGSLRLRADIYDTARVITSSLEGSMVLAYSYGDTSRFTVAAGHLLAGLSADQESMPTT